MVRKTTGSNHSIGMNPDEYHVPDDDLEQYHLGMVTEETELAGVEEHLLACADCVARAQQIERFVDRMRAALLELDDLLYPPAEEPLRADAVGA